MDLRNDLAFSKLIAGSYARLVGSPLIPKESSVADTARWLYQDARFCLVAHNRDPDPRFIYANMSAQACFEYPWDEFLRLPSRLSAEEVSREGRQRLLDAVTRDGVITNYCGVRITRSGRRGVSWLIASFTQSAGLPATAVPLNAFSTSTLLVKSGWLSVIPCPVALCTVSGATTCTWAMSVSFRYIATRPGAVMPSSLVRRINFLFSAICSYSSIEGKL